MTRFGSVSPVVVVVVASLLSLLSPCAGFAASKGGTKYLRSVSCHAFAGGDDNGGENITLMGRRKVLDNIAAIAAASFSVATTSTPPALALDFDAFESSEISKDSSSLVPELNDDEALCKYGAPGKAMGDACKRAGMKPRLPSVVDASGNVDRGEYLKCAYEYPIVDGKYVKTRVCK